MVNNTQGTFYSFSKRQKMLIAKLQTKQVFLPSQMQMQKKFMVIIIMSSIIIFV